MRSREFSGRCSRAATAALCVLLSVITAGPGARASNETYTYDNAGRLVVVEHGDGKVTTYTLDPAGNRTNVKTEIPGSPGTLSIASVSGTYPESQGTVSIVIRRASGTMGAASVGVAASFTGSANSADASVSPSSVSWADGDGTDKTVTVTIADDSVVEANETFDIVISGPSGAILGPPTSITLTITNDDVADTTPPAAPANLTANPVSSSQIDLGWLPSSDPSGILEYRIERCTGAGCSNFTQIATRTTTSFSNTGLTENTSYTYRVRAVDNANNVGQPSATATTATLDATLPTAPTNLTATPTSATQVNLSWTASTDANGISQYRVERCSGSGCSNFTQITTTTTTSYGNTGLTESTSYSYRVRAVDGASNVGPYSGVASATTLDVTPPPAPTGLTATAASATQINLSWIAPADVSGIALYRIERCAGSGCSNFNEIATTASTAYNNTGLAEATSYSYRVRAVDGATLVGAYSSVATRATLDVTGPAAPTNLAATATSNTQINLSWAAPSDISGISLYRIERCTGSGCSNFSEISTTSSTSYSNTGLLEITPYSYRVRAVDGENNTGSYSSTASATTLDATGPSAPGNLTANPVSAIRVDLAWNAATDNVGVTGYRVERCLASNCSYSQIGTTASNVLTYSDTSTQQLTNYNYRVRAVDAVPNTGAYSNVASASTPDGTPPSAPSSLSASAVSPNQINLSWAASSDNVGVDSYTIYRDGSPVATSTTTSYADNVLQPSTTYTYQVYAYDAANNQSGASNSAQATTQPLPDSTPPTVPGNLNGSAISSTQVNLSWNPSTDSGGSGLVGYRLYRNGSLLATVAASASPTVNHSDTTTVGSTSYSYVVYAYDGNNNQSAASNTKAINTPDTIPPTAPTGLSATAINGNTIRLTWNGSTEQGSSGSIYYWIYRNGSSTPVNSVAVIHPNVTYDDGSASSGTTYSYVVRARDTTGNTSGDSNTASATTPSVLAAAVSNTSWTYFKSSTMTINPPPISVTASGGSGGYTYQWQQVSGPDSSATPTSPTGSSTRWTRTLPNADVQYDYVWRCKVTDSSGGVIYTSNVQVTFIRTTTNFAN
jgi:YD repeat-containing protein